MTATQSKALRLLAAGAAQPADARVYHVQGDHASYIVVVGAAQTCTCPATGACSHLLAAQLLDAALLREREMAA